MLDDAANRWLTWLQHATGKLLEVATIYGKKLREGKNSELSQNSAELRVRHESGFYKVEVGAMFTNLSFKPTRRVKSILFPSKPYELYRPAIYIL
ncbi:MAG TPA: hypothetical protein VK603_21265, partial [Candidatus Saccharimonadales bacterium]|nr:hypothetical protein [Candidatus Saccharimonadales bacterium]